MRCLKLPFRFKGLFVSAGKKNKNKRNANNNNTVTINLTHLSPASPVLSQKTLLLAEGASPRHPRVPCPTPRVPAPSPADRRGSVPQAALGVRGCRGGPHVPAQPRDINPPRGTNYGTNGTNYVRAEASGEQQQGSAATGGRYVGAPAESLPHGDPAGL